MPEHEQTVMISACLLGAHCRYDGGSKPVSELKEVFKDFRVIPFCPEILGNLIAPRPPAEIQNGTGEDVWQGKARVVNRDGIDCSEAFIMGARKVLELYQRESPRYIVLKANSPSCGVARIYDGSFTAKLREGHGVTTALLLQNGAKVFTEVDLLSCPRGILE